MKAALAGMLLRSGSSMSPYASLISEILQLLRELKSNREKTRSKRGTTLDGEKQFVSPPCTGQFSTEVLESTFRPTHALCQQTY